MDENNCMDQITKTLSQNRNYTVFRDPEVKNRVRLRIQGVREQFFLETTQILESPPTEKVYPEIPPGRIEQGKLLKGT